MARDRVRILRIGACSHIVARLADENDQVSVEHIGNICDGQTDIRTEPGLRRWGVQGA